MEIYAKLWVMIFLYSTNEIMSFKPKASQSRMKFASKYGDVVNFANLKEHPVSFQNKFEVWCVLSATNFKNPGITSGGRAGRRTRTKRSGQARQ